jgi:hypothetical protein
MSYALPLILVIPSKVNVRCRTGVPIAQHYRRSGGESAAIDKHVEPLAGGSGELGHGRARVQQATVVADQRERQPAGQREPHDARIAAVQHPEPVHALIHIEVRHVGAVDERCVAPEA